MAARSFGSQFCTTMAVCPADGDRFDEPDLRQVGALALHPGTHALHYGSVCFEGLKAHRGPDGVVRIFRLDAHVERMRFSAAQLCLPVPPAELLAGMIRDVVVANRDEVPSPPGALYLRPVLMGTEVNIGAAARPSGTALLYVIASPVGDYFDPARALTVAVETGLPRTTPQFGRVKTGANYAMALGVTRGAAVQHGADQVLFAPGGVVQETGASNVMLIDEGAVITPALTDAFLHGVTRDSVLTLARSHGLGVDERDVTVAELSDRAGQAEVALSGTAAVLAPVGTLVIAGRRVEVGGGVAGAVTSKLREALVAVQRGEAADDWGWTTAV